MVRWDAIHRVRDTVRQESRWSSFPGIELIVMFIVVVGAVQFAYLLLGIKNVVIVTVFAVAWLRPVVTRLLDLRRGQYLPWKRCALRRFEAAVLLIGGIAPWAILFLLNELDPSSVARQSVELPMWVRACGAALAIVMVAKKKTPTGGNQNSSLRARLLMNVTLDSQLMIVSMLMMSGSVFIGLLATGWMLSACVSFSAERLPAAWRLLEGSRLTAVPLGFHSMSLYNSIGRSTNRSDLIGCEPTGAATTSDALAVTEG